MSTKVEIIGKATNVVEIPGLTIQEVVGNVSTATHDKNDDFSLAIVTIDNPTSEPVLTIDYDEYIHVIEGEVELHQFSSKEEKVASKLIKVSAGETVFIEKGTRFQPIFPQGKTKYIPVCLPAFRPERCQREDEGIEKLNELHREARLINVKSTPNGSIDASTVDAKLKVNANFNHVSKVYHMCQKSLWDACVSKSTAYFPPTFHQDGNFTHATAFPERLITTANHFYTSTKGEWICLELSRWELEKLGIVTIFEEAKPVGETATKENWDDWVCPHIFGGLPTHIDGIVLKTYNMKRNEDGVFLSITGLVD